MDFNFELRKMVSFSVDDLPVEDYWQISNIWSRETVAKMFESLPEDQWLVFWEDPQSFSHYLEVMGKEDMYEVHLWTSYIVPPEILDADIW